MIESQKFNTPFLSINLNEVRSAYRKLHKLLPSVEIHYAVKCNPNDYIIRTIADCGGQFEVSSYEELKKVMANGISPETVLFTNPIKLTYDISQANKAGIAYFAFDSKDEIDRLSKYAPKAKAYVRVAIPVKRSEVASEGKFGVSLDVAKKLLIYAKKRGLDPCGVSFHVGSQMLDPSAWYTAIEYGSQLFSTMERYGIKLTLLDIGGGFPVCYDGIAEDNLEKSTELINAAIKKYLPSNVKIIAEPGRFLVAYAGTMVSSVIGRATRFERNWLHLDVGAFNGLMESLETANNLAFPVYDSVNDKEKEIFTLTGPTCDSQDTVLFDVALSKNIKTGSRIFLKCAGAYTTAFTEKFNGFPDPQVIIEDE